MNKKSKIGIIISSILIFSITNITNSSAQEAKTLRLKAGKQAPYDGFLLSDLAAIRNKVYLENVENLFDIKLERALAVNDAEHSAERDKLMVLLEHEKEKAKIDIQYNETQLKLLQRQLEENSSFFNSYKFGIVVGIVCTASMLLITAKVIQLTK